MSWAAPNDHEFSIRNLPYGIFSTPSMGPRVGVAVGDFVLDMAELAKAGIFHGVEGLDALGCFAAPSLNAFMGCSRPVWRATRARLVELLSTGDDASGNGGGGGAFVDHRALKNNAPLRAAALLPRESVSMHLPAKIGDYTDFYSSREHATNVGTMFRGADNALQPNWLHLPVGYHGRSSSVFVSGVNVVRPSGQLQKDAADPSQGSTHGPCRLLDFELEMAFFVGGAGLAPGQTLSMEDAEEHIFGLVLMNDWSARDIQKWEYVPLGPFGAKNFATSISPWVVTLDALEPFRCKTSAGKQDSPVPLPYLQDPNYGSYDISLEVAIQGEGMEFPAVVTRSNFKNMYWNMKQQLVHHAVTGCNMQPGDLLGSGTISGTEPNSFGSMLELSWKGTKEVVLEPEHSSSAAAQVKHVRKFLKDGDRVTISGVCQGSLSGVGFGSVSGTVLPCSSPLIPSLGFGDSSATTATMTAVPPQLVSREPRFRNFVLYGYWRSSCSWRVRICLSAKNIPFETRPVNLLQGAQKGADHSGRNPLMQVPVLEFEDTHQSDGGGVVRISQSLAIIDFLEEAFPAQASSGVVRGSLLPADPILRARARELSEMVNAGMQPLQNLSTFKRIDALVDILRPPSSPPALADPPELTVGRAFAKEAIEKGLGALEAKMQHLRTNQSLATASALFACGVTFPTVADACLVPQLFNARRFNVNLDEVCPTLLSIESACAVHPWFVAAHPDNQPDAVIDAQPSAGAAAEGPKAKKMKA